MFIGTHNRIPMHSSMSEQSFCLNAEQMRACISQLLLGQYDRLPVQVRDHVSACIHCRKKIVGGFNLRIRELGMRMPKRPDSGRLWRLAGSSFHREVQVPEESVH